MLTLISIAGFIIAVIIFLNLLSAGTRVRRQAERDRSRPKVNFRKHMAKAREQDESAPRLRLCPLCGTVLNQDEYLFASFLEEPPETRKRQVHIYGCRHCFRTDGVNLRSRELSQIEP